MRLGARPALVTLWLAACHLTPAAAPVAPAVQVLDVPSVIAFRGRLQLDPAGGYDLAEGEAWQFLYYSEDALFDALTCYPDTNQCAAVDLVRGSGPDDWSADHAQGVPDAPPFALHYRVAPNGDWRRAARAELRVSTPGLGEVATTTLARDAAAQPPPGVREGIRAEQTLRTVYEAIALRYQAMPPGERHFPEARAQAPGPLPCGPTRFERAEDLDWLGLSAPAVLDWAFSVEADAQRGQLRLIARRDRTCKGDIETRMLSARLDAYGDLERTPITAPIAR